MEKDNLATFLRAWGSVFSENYSEVAFTPLRHFTFAQKFAKRFPWLNAGFKGDLKGWKKALNTINNAQKKAQVGGFLEELSEEELNNVMSAIINATADDEYFNTLFGELDESFSLDNQIDLALGLLPMQIAFGGIRGSVHGVNKYSNKKIANEIQSRLSKFDMEFANELASKELNIENINRWAHDNIKKIKKNDKLSESEKDASVNDVLRTYIDYCQNMMAIADNENAIEASGEKRVVGLTTYSGSALTNSAVMLLMHKKGYQVPAIITSPEGVVRRSDGSIDIVATSRIDGATIKVDEVVNDANEFLDVNSNLDIKELEDNAVMLYDYNNGTEIKTEAEQNVDSQESNQVVPSINQDGSLQIGTNRISVKKIDNVAYVANQIGGQTTYDIIRSNHMQECTDENGNVDLIKLSEIDKSASVKTRMSDVNTLKSYLKHTADDANRQAYTMRGLYESVAKEAGIKVQLQRAEEKGETVVADQQGNPVIDEQGDVVTLTPEEQAALQAQAEKRAFYASLPLKQAGNKKGTIDYEQLTPEQEYQLEEYEGGSGIEALQEGYEQEIRAINNLEAQKGTGSMTPAQRRAALREHQAKLQAYKEALAKHQQQEQVAEQQPQQPVVQQEQPQAEPQAFVEEQAPAVEEPQPIGRGVFGDIYDQFKGKAKAAIDFLLKKRSGEALGALHHKEIGDIDLVWGEEGTGRSDGYGLAKMAKYHPEVMGNLQEILDDMHVVQRSENRINLESDKYKAAIRLSWDNQSKTWLLTAFEKKESSAINNTTDTAETPEGKRNDTATPQNTASADKGTENNSDKQEDDDVKYYDPKKQRQKSKNRTIADTIKNNAATELINNADELAGKDIVAENGYVVLSKKKGVDVGNHYPAMLVLKAEDANNDFIEENYDILPNAEARIVFDSDGKYAGVVVTNEGKQQLIFPDGRLSKSTSFDNLYFDKEQKEVVLKSVRDVELDKAKELGLEKYLDNKMLKVVILGGDDRQLSVYKFITNPSERSKFVRDDGSELIINDGVSILESKIKEVIEILNKIKKYDSRLEKALNTIYKPNTKTRLNAENRLSVIKDAIDDIVKGEQTSTVELQEEPRADKKDNDSKPQEEKPKKSGGKKQKKSVKYKSIGELQKELRDIESRLEEAETERDNARFDGKTDAVEYAEKQIKKLKAEQAELTKELEDAQAAKYRAVQEINKESGGEFGSLIDYDIDYWRKAASQVRIPEDEMRRAVRRLEQLQKEFGVKVQAYATREELEAAAEQGDTSAAMALAEIDLAKGWYSQSTGRCCVYLPNVDGVEDVTMTYVHEVVAHYGLRQLFSGEQEYNDFVSGIYNHLSKEEKAVIDKMMEDEGLSLAAAMDEWIADVSEKQNWRAEPKNKSVWDYIVDFFRKLFNKKAGVNEEFTTEDFVEYILRLSSKNLREGGKSAEIYKGEIETLFRKSAEPSEEDMAYISNEIAEKANIVYGEHLEGDGTRFRRVYHGTGYKFDKFNHEKMGDGQGSQAYGWGTYATEVNGIARRYARHTYQKSDNATGRYIYDIEIPDPNGFNYLPWKDGVSKEQAKAIRQSMFEQIEELYGKKEDKIMEYKHEVMSHVKSKVSGMQVYTRMEDILKSGEAVSKLLDGLGIIGVQYPANLMQGGNKDGASNYVIFNEDNMKITDTVRFRKRERADAQAWQVSDRLAEEMATIKETAIADGTFMKAPNGKQSNLNERNWLLVRTKEFKDWFGDWETQAKSTYLFEHLPIVELDGTEFAPDGVKLTDKVPAFYQEQYNGKVTRDGIGDVLLDKESVKDSISHGVGRMKSAAFAAVPKIIQDGIIIDSQNNWKERNYDSVTIAAPITISGERYIGVAVVKRLPNDKNRFYLHEVILQKNLLNDNIKTDTKVGYHQGDIANVLKNFVTHNTNSSKVVDENGEPLVVYHGSPSNFTEFDMNSIGKTTGTSDGRGFYFTTDKDFAKGYSTYDGSVMEVFLNIKNPLDFNKKTITQKQLEDIVREIDRVEMERDGEHYFISNYGNYYDEGVPRVIKETAKSEYEYNDDDVELLNSMSNSSGDFPLVAETFEKVLGKSNVIVPKENGTTHYVMTNRADIKSATENESISNDPDIRFRKKTQNYLEGSEKVSKFVTVNVTQNAGEDGKENRLSGSNEADRVAYKQALSDLRNPDLSDEERKAAEAVMAGIQKRRKAQMQKLAKESLKGIKGVRLVEVQEGTGVYMAGTQEVVEYTSSIQLEVDEGQEQAAIAAMAALAETTKQDIFIVNYPDEYKRETEYDGQEGYAANVTVQANEDLSPSQVAEISEAFTKAGLGVTITGREITTSNFDDSITIKQFSEKVISILNLYNYGNAETTLHNERRVAGMEKQPRTGTDIGSVRGSRNQSINDNNSFNYGNAETTLRNTARVQGLAEQRPLQEVGRRIQGEWFSGVVGYNKSSYNSAKQNDNENFIDRYGNETTTERYYGNYYGATEEESSLDVPIQGTSITPNDILGRLADTLQSTEQEIILGQPDVKYISGDIRFRKSAREDGEVYRSQVKELMLAAKQEMFDSLAYVDELSKELEKALGRKLNPSENPYTMHTRVEAIAAARQGEVMTDHYDKLQEAYGELINLVSKVFPTRNVKEHVRLAEAYLYARDQQERIEMQRAARKDKRITKLELKKYEEKYAEWLDNFEYELNITPSELITKVEGASNSDEVVNKMWSALKSASDWILNYEYKSSMLSKEEYERLSQRQYYVRESDTADINEYLTEEEKLERINRGSSGYGRSGFGRNEGLRHSEGRGTLASNPIVETIYLMLDTAQSSAINEANKLLVEYAMNKECAAAMDREGIKIESQYRYKDGRPQIPTIEEVAEYERLKSIMDDKDAMLNDRYAALFAIEQMGIVPNKFRNRRGNDISVRLNGRLYRIRTSYIPNDESNKGMRLHYALSHRQFRNALAPVRKFTKFVSNAWTSLNWAFAPVNLVRDYGFVLSAGFLEEGAKFSATVMKNMLSIKSEATTIGGYIVNGKLDESTEFGRLFKQFIENGGSGGFSLSRKNKIELKEELDKKAKGGKPWYDKLRTIASTPAEYSELIVRFNVYRSAIECGRDSDRAMYLARNLNINFDIKGAKKSFFMQTVSSFLPFTDAILGSVRAVGLLGKSAVKHPIRFSIIVAWNIAKGFLFELFNDLIGGDEWEEEIAEIEERYKNGEISEEKREFLIKGVHYKKSLHKNDTYGDRYLTIDGFRLPQEPRIAVFTDLGRYIYMVMHDRMKPKELVKRTCMNVLRNFTPLAILPDTQDLSIENLLKASPPIAPFVIGYQYITRESKDIWSGHRPQYNMDWISLKMSELLSEQTGIDDIQGVGESRFDIAPRFFKEMSSLFMPSAFRQLSYNIASLLFGHTDELSAHDMFIAKRFMNDQEKVYERNKYKTVKYVDDMLREIRDVQKRLSMKHYGGDRQKLEEKWNRFNRIVNGLGITIYALEDNIKAYKDFEGARMAYKLGYSQDDIERMYESINVRKDVLEANRDEIFYDRILPAYLYISDYLQNNEEGLAYKNALTGFEE